MKKYNFSFVVPTYNRAYILSRAIESILSQHGGHELEIIIIDDGSTDTTEAIVSNYDKNIVKFFKQNNAGPSSARNLGLSKATKEWIVYLDSDNFLMPDYLDVVERYLTANHIATYAFVRARKTKELYENSVVIKSIEDPENNLSKASLEELCTFKTIYFDVNGFIHKRKLFTEEIKWDVNLVRLEDWEFFLQIAEKHPKEFLYIPEPIVHYYMRLGDTDSIISKFSYSDWADAFEYIYQKHQKDKLLINQTWYPSRVTDYRTKQEKFNRREVGPDYIKFFT